MTLGIIVTSNGRQSKRLLFTVRRMDKIAFQHSNTETIGILVVRSI